MNKLKTQQTAETKPAMGEVTEAQLYLTKQRDDGFAAVYIKWWRNLNARCRHPPGHRDAIQMCKGSMNMHNLLKEIGIEVKSFDQLNYLETNVEALLAKHCPTTTTPIQKNKLAGEC